MNNAAVIEHKVPIVAKHKPAPKSKGIGLFLPGAFLAVTLGASVWLFQRGIAENGGKTDLLAIAGAAAAFCGACISFGIVISRSKRFYSQELSSFKAEKQSLILSLEVQLSESHKKTERLHETLRTLEKDKSELEYKYVQASTELGQLKRTERNLSQERQVLESSKAVLELHVQARTKELQRLQRRYELILNSAGEGICGVDLDGRTTFVNPAVATLTGWEVEQLTGKTEQEIFGNIFSGEQNHGECTLTRKDGAAFPVEFVRTPLCENDRAVGSVVVFRDITERKRVEEKISQKAAELARSNAELEQFAFVASHDLQEPLRKIQAFGDRLKLKCDAVLPEEAKDYLDRMQGASARMRTLINDLLAFSRVIRSSEPFVAVNLDQITREVLGDLEFRIEKSGAKIELHDLPTLEADAMQMRQLMLNLIGNALKFQAPGVQPVIHIRSRKIVSPAGQDFYEISVQDNGIGFEEKYLDKIFAVFQRLHGRNEYEGTGVGLAVCRRITDRHQGTITARSELGKGATFVITLPAVQPQPTATK